MTHRNPHHSFLESTLRAIYRMSHERCLARFAGALSAFTPVLALANPSGGQVMAGSATIGTAGSNGVVVNQSSHRASINWQQFSIGSNEYVQFNQPNSSSVVLNRVIGSNPSSIFGEIKANGQVFLINPNGILFAPGSSLDVSSLTASTLDTSDAHFMAGRYVFSRDQGSSTATIVNQGNITTAKGGYVVLAGDYVENDGVINAQSGRVVLASGSRANLTLSNGGGLISYQVDAPTLARLAGVDNTGSIVANGGAVVMTADVANSLTATAVNNSGFITAHSVSQKGGVIELLSQGGGIENSGTLDATATHDGVAGGTIIVRGNGHTQLTPASRIMAGGDQAAGGFIELSGHTLGVRGLVKTGQGGNLLLDPAKIHITAGNGVNQVSTGTGTIGTGFIASHLQSGNVAVVASNSISRTGGSHISATGAGRLTFAIGTVPVGASCGIGGICAGTGFPVVTPLVGTIDLTGLTIKVGGLVSIQDSQGGVTVGPITAHGGIFVRAGQIHVNGNLSAPSNEISLAAAPGLSRGLIKVASGKVLSGGSVNLNMSDSYGGVISAGAINATQRISIDLNNRAGSSADLIKIGALTAPQISVFASGKKEQITTGAITANAPHGPASVMLGETIGSNGTGIITVNGAINVTGRTAGSNSGFGGVFGPEDLPPAAGLDVNISGTAPFTGNIKLNGALNVTAIAHAYADASNNEAGPVASRLQSGTGGLATTFISVNGSHGSASIAGDINTHGPDALVIVQAQNVAVHNVTVTGSGHKVHRSIVARASGGAYSSSNSAGQAGLVLGGVPGTSSHSAPGISDSVKAGNITVSGKGLADAELFASNVSAGDISVTATAAHGKITQDRGNIGLNCSGQCPNENSGAFYRGMSQTQLHLGSIDMGRANLQIGLRGGSSIGSSPATTIKIGNVTMDGVGAADLRLFGKSIQTQGLDVVVTKGTEKGSGSSSSGRTGSNHYIHNFNVNGGEADIEIRSGGSTSGGVLTQNGGPVTIGGDVVATGPAASVDIKGKTVKIGGNITVTGTGETFTSDTVFTPATGTGYHVHVTGGSEPTALFLQGATSGSVSVAGKTSLKGPGLVGAIVIGGSVKLHGLTASASASVNYSILDTRVSPTAQNFTAGSVMLVAADVGVAGGKPAFTSASDVGDLGLKAKGNVDMAAVITVSGGLNVQAGGNIVGSSDNVVSRFSALGNAHPHASSHNSGSGGPSPGTLPALTLKANAVFMQAGGDIDLSASKLNIGTGVVLGSNGQPMQAGDTALLDGLGQIGLAPGSADPNGAFIAGGSVALGGLTLNGSYLYLQAADISLLGKVAAPKGAVVQLVPNGTTGSIDAEGNGAAGATLNLNDNGSFNVFPDGITLVLGGAGQTGPVTLGGNGTFDIGSDNLIVDTTGTITGLGNVISTGQVISLASLLSPLPPVTAGEIDPTSNTTSPTDKDKQGQGQGLGDTGTGTQPSISQDTGNSSVCH